MYKVFTKMDSMDINVLLKMIQMLKVLYYYIASDDFISRLGPAADATIASSPMPMGLLSLLRSLNAWSCAN